MPVLRLNIFEGQIHCPEATDVPLRNVVAERLEALGPRDPVVILLHGYRYSPLCRFNDAHKLIFCERHRTEGPRRFSVSWPSALGFAPGQDRRGLCMPVSWDAKGPLRDVYHRAEEVGRQMADLLDLLAELEPGRPVHLMAHSLGARVALAAISVARCPVVRRLILLAPAEFGTKAELALQSRGGEAMEVLQVSPVENRFFDLLLSRGLGLYRGSGPTIGGGGVSARNWARLRIDTKEDLAQLAKMGFPVGSRTSRICHWSAYLRPGLMSLYSACFSEARIASFACFARGS